MKENRLIIIASPVAFQKITVMQDNIIVDSLGVTADYLVDTVHELIDKYNINVIDFAGATEFTHKFGQEIQNKNIAKYQNLIINYKGWN